MAVVGLSAPIAASASMASTGFFHVSSVPDSVPVGFSKSFSRSSCIGSRVCSLSSSPNNCSWNAGGGTLNGSSSSSCSSSGSGMRWRCRPGGPQQEDSFSELLLSLARGRTRKKRSRCFVVVRAQRSRFSQTYSRSSHGEIERLVHKLCTSEESAAKTLAKYGTEMKPPDWFNVLDGIGRRRRWLLALEVFRWIQVQKWYKADNGYYSKLISIMGKERQFRMAMTIFKEMKKMGCRPDTSLYNSILTVYIRTEDKGRGFENACSLLEEMKLIRRCQPNIVSYNILTRAAAQLGDQGTVTLLFKDLFSRDLSPDEYTFNGVMDAYGKAGDIPKMEETVQRMRDHSVKPDVVTFNTLIDAYGRAGEFEKMEQVLKSMTLKRKSPIQPAAKTFNSMISSYGNAGLVEKFEGAFRDMKDLGISPSFITYESLIGAYGKCGLYDRMRNCVKRMKIAGLLPTTSTLNKLLEMYCLHGKTNEAESLLRNSEEECGVKAISTSYAVVIRALMKARHHSSVLSLLDRMKVLGLTPTKQTYIDVMQLIGAAEDGAQDRNSHAIETAPQDVDGPSGFGQVTDAGEEDASRVDDLIGAVS